MVDISRRDALGLLGTAAVSVGGIGTATARGSPSKGRIRKLGHSLLSNPPGGYAEGDVRDDGQYALLGSFLGEGGSFLVDIRNPTDPTEVHRLPSDADVRNADVKFDTRDGLYYRSQEPNTDDATFHGVELVDYGYDVGSPEDPAVIARLDAGETHNVFPHPNAPYLYSVNAHGAEAGEENTGFDVFDVSDPHDPVKVTEAGPAGSLHDVVVDPDTGFMHCAYIGGALDGYVIVDVSDPADPSEVGRFDYAGRPDYTEERLANGEPGFQSCHYADYDPERGLAIVGDEVACGVPGGKHVFDIGWGDGSPQDPKHVGFTYSPNAEVQCDGDDGAYDWTTHNHDVVPKDDTSLLVDGGYHEGTVVYDISDPTDPTPTDRYRTDDGATEDVNDNPIFDLGEAPMAWGADWNEARDLVVTSDFFTGVYVFKVTPTAATGGGSGNGGS